MKGLTSLEAKKRLSEIGPNVITEAKKKSLILKFFEHFNNFLIYLLIGASIISLSIGDTLDGILILSIVVLNALFGFYQEAKAEESIKALKKMIVAQVRVIRDGKQKEISSAEVVPGDLVFLEEGVKIPADGKLIESVNIEISEAAFTGESLPVSKKLKDKVFMGTIVAKGRGYLEVEATGMNTEFGKIAGSMLEVKEERTPLQKRLEDLTKVIGYVGIVAALVVFALSNLQGLSYIAAFLLAVSLAIAVVPKGLPAVMKITLAIGVREMAKRKSIIKKLSAIEGLGSVTLIATDKTGTLTTNQMKVKEMHTDEKDKNLLLLNGVLCSTASLIYTHDKKEMDVLGDPTEGALLLLGREHKLSENDIRSQWKVLDENPFDSITKIMSVLVKKNNEKYIFSKGSPEAILSRSKMTADKKEKITNILNNWGRQGLRVLAFSYTDLKKSKDIKIGRDLKDMHFLGMVAIHDPLRPEATEAVRKARSAGIKVVMITGDNEKTAQAIAVAAGIIEVGDEIMTGSQVEGYTDEELTKHLERVKVFARTTPFHKHRIVKLYQAIGEIVAVTGDGVNDAIAIKQANVGIAMGLVGTDVARETADMVITDDNFATIVNAVEEGRNIVRNLKNSVKYLLAGNMAEALVLITGLLIGIPHLLYPIQILYINLLSDGIPALALGFSPRDKGLMSLPPAKKLQLLNLFDKSYIFVVGILATSIVLFSYYLFGNGELGRTTAFSVLVLIQSYIFIDLWLSHGKILKNLRKFKSMLFAVAFMAPFLLQYILIKNETIASVFKIVPVNNTLFVKWVLIAGSILVILELIKLFIKKKVKI